MICVPSFTLIENFLTDERWADGGGAGLTNLERWGLWREEEILPDKDALIKSKHMGAEP